MEEVEIDGRQEQQPRRGRLRRTLKYLTILIAVLLIAVIVAVVYTLGKLSVTPLGFGGLKVVDGRTNILVLGIGDPGHAGQNLSDTMMVISLDKAKHEVAMIGVPRDLRVDVADYGYSKINAANALGGPALAEQTVSSTLGIPIQYYVLTDFSGLQQLVDAVGGITVTVTEPLVDTEYPCANNQAAVCGLNIQPGTYHMNGALALEYTRCRKGTCGNDFGRDARQQQVLQILRQKIFTPGVYLNPVHDNAILQAIRQNAKTDLTVDNMIETGWAMEHSKKTIQFVFSTAPGGFLTSAPDSSDLIPIGGSFVPMQEYAQQIFN